MDADDLIARVAEWSRGDSRVNAAGLVGSYARGDQRPDSDVDFCILSPQPAALLDDRAWIADFGSPARISNAVEDYHLVQSIRVFYGSLEVEFGVTDEAWAEPPIDSGTAAVINDGLRILVDPEGRLAVAQASASRLCG